MLIIEGACDEFGERVVHDIPLLFTLCEDPAEKYDISDKHLEVLTEIDEMVEKHKQNLVTVKDQLTERESN